MSSWRQLFLSHGNLDGINKITSEERSLPFGNKNAYAGPHTAVGWNIFLKKTIVGFRILESRNLP